MFFRFKDWLIEILGGVTEHKYQVVVRENNAKSEEVEAYRKFIDSIHIYAGNYPAWKAQQEYREYLYKIGLPLKKNHDVLHPENRDYLDIYLGRIVDAFVALMEEGYFNHKQDIYWNEFLSVARGDDYLSP